MKTTLSIFLAVVCAVIFAVSAAAQSAETIWLSPGATSYKTGETVIVYVNAVSGTPIQGLTFQIRYDPACLQPVGATSPIPGMNGMSLPQTLGLVDASFASTTPQMAGGIIADVRFLALGACQTILVLESAALAVRNAEGFAAPLPNVSIGENSIALTLNKEVGDSQIAPPVSGGTPLPLGSEEVPAAETGIPIWLVAFLLVVVGATGVIITILVLRRPPTSSSRDDFHSSSF